MGMKEEKSATKPSARNNWRASRSARLGLNFTARQLVLGYREWRMWWRVFCNLLRLERSPVKAFRRTMLMLSGHPRKRLERR